MTGKINFLSRQPYIYVFNFTMNKLFLPVVCVLLLQACNSTNSSSSKMSDILASHRDTTIVPGDDFFNYTNGGWIKENPIPKSESGWGIFNLVDEENLARVKRISEDATSTQAAKGTATQQIGDFFSAGMDSAAIEANGIKPLQPLLDKINAIQTVEDITRAFTFLLQHGVSVGYAGEVYQDMKNSEKMFFYLGQSGLGLPDRDYYFNTDSQTTSIRRAYPEHIAAQLRNVLPTSTTATADAAAIVALETQMASSHKQLAELRDPYANYHKMALNELQKLAPAINWTNEFTTMGVKTDSVIVGQPAFFQKLNSLLTTVPVATWKSYLMFHAIATYAPYLSTSFDQEDFRFYNQLLNGTKEQRPRWKRVLDAQEDALGDALGQLYVKEFFPEKTKKRYDNLVDQIIISYREHIQKLDWMSDSTKQKAIGKLNAITRKVGYPNTWRDYSKMNITQDSYCSNVMEGKKWHIQYELNKLGKPVDRTEWGMTPQTYNAYYNPSNNEIVLPAAIFTAPGYKDDELDDALVYGYVGASTIGHELTHGFDDEGRQFDAKGNLKNWWTKEDETNFKKRADMLVAQFDSFVLLGDKHPNGRATLGENIADLGGIVIALDAFKKTKQFKEGKLKAGLTPLQRYFMGYAYGWMQTRTNEKMASLLLTDVHAPIFLRVNGPMSNCDAWYEAFNVKPGHAMYRAPEARVRIW
jgi:putative endopeptidase